MRHTTNLVTINMGAADSGTQIIEIEGLLRPRLHLISPGVPDIDIKFSDISVRNNSESDIYGIGGAQYQVWQSGITLVANTLLKSTTPSHVATDGLMVSNLAIEWTNAGAAVALHVFVVGEET
jgi:hypothetical protein